MEKIIFKNVKIKLGERTLFENLNFAINKGDKLMFLGKNGSGKSLLLELLSFGLNKDLTSRYKGLSVEGNIEDEMGNNYLNPNQDKNIAYISQVEDFYNNSTILDEAEISSLGSGLELDEDFLDYLLEKFHLLDKKKKKIKNNVSFGEGKAIHIITKLMKIKQCDVLVLDEPLNHLSFQNSKIFNDVINEILIKKPDLTILMISHCKAVDFLDKYMKYDYNKNEMYFTPYKCVRCFNDDEFDLGGCN